MPEVSELEPSLVWKHFAKILEIPRSSGNEEQMREYIRQFAKKHNLTYQQDDFGNLVVRKPASPGKEDVASTALQSHLDMVCEKEPEVKHDFDKDPIETEILGDYLQAKNTTLGSDNGIGVAASLAALEDPELIHGPIECLFTMEEETGLVGARNLDPTIVKSRRLINLDSEERGTIYIGCAGGGDSTTQLSLTWEACPEQYACLEIAVRGLKGGHSGCDIHIGRGNAIVILNRILWSLKKQFHFRLNSFLGGDKHNAIPRYAKATLAICSSEKDNFLHEARAKLARIQEEFGPIEPNMSLTFQDCEQFAKVVSKKSENQLLSLIKVIPHGVIAMNPDIPSMVNTSNNLAKVVCSQEECSILTSTRSSLDEALEAVRETIEAGAKIAGAKITHHETYPGWKPNLASRIVQITKQSYQQALQHEAEIKSIHAGLECGVLGEKIPDMDMVSIGPQIENPHSPTERVSISSVKEFWQALAKTLENLAQKESAS